MSMNVNMGDMPMPPMPPMPMPMTPAEMIYSMQMTFGFTTDAGYILFEGFKVESGTQFFYALLLILAMALLTESISFFMWYQKFTAGKPEAGDR